MLWTNTKRVIRAGFVNFWRNGFVSLSSILVMIITLFVVGSIIFSGAILQSVLTQLSSKVDVNVYFVTSAKEDDILAMKTQLEAMPEVATVEYVTREQVLEKFKASHANDELTTQALDEVGENPFGAELNIVAKNPSQYESISKFLQGESALEQGGSPIIDSVNYSRNKAAITTLSKIIDSADKLGLILTMILTIVSVLITFNTIRLAIYISKDEIAVMRLVGASNKYIRGPFVIIGVLYGLISALITLAVFYPITFWFFNSTKSLGLEINIFNYYLVHFGEIFLIIAGSGILIGGISSYLAVRKYLKV